MTHLKQCTILAAALVTAAFQAPLQARTCTGNSDVLGFYGYFGSRGSVFLAGATAPGTTAAGAPILIPTGGTTTPTTITGSNTPYGRFVVGLANNGAFASNGRIYFDGSGGVYAASTTGSLLLNTQAGTYSVTSDCSIKLTLTDSFVSNASTETTTLPSVTLEGEVSDNRIDAVVTGANAAGASVTFVRTSQANSCSNANLQGNYSISGSGFGLTGSGGTGGTGTGGTGTGGTTTTTGAFTNGAVGTLGTPFTLLGRFTADGNGNFVADPSQTTSPLKRTLTGTYTVNVDCTGTATLTDNAGVIRTASFVIVNDNARCLSGPSTSPQSLEFAFTNTGIFGQATATKQ